MFCPLRIAKKTTFGQEIWILGMLHTSTNGHVHFLQDVIASDQDMLLFLTHRTEDVDLNPCQVLHTQLTAKFAAGFEYNCKSWYQVFWKSSLWRPITLQCRNASQLILITENTCHFSTLLLTTVDSQGHFWENWLSISPVQMSEFSSLT